MSFDLWLCFAHFVIPTHFRNVQFHRWQHSTNKYAHCPTSWRVPNSLNPFSVRNFSRIYVTRCTMQKVAFFSVAIVAFAANIAFGLYFHISETKRKCFVQDIPDDTTVVGKQTQTHFVTLFTYTFPVDIYIYMRWHFAIENWNAFVNLLDLFISVQYRVEVHNPETNAFEPLPPNLGITPFHWHVHDKLKPF